MASPNLTFSSKIKNWLLTNPQYNPYRFSINSSYKFLTSFLREIPNAIIIGSSKGGKTSLLSYLNQHPKIKFGTGNSVGTYFFDGSFNSHSFTWYKSNFPIKSSKYKIIGEAPGTYLNHPLAPERIKNYLPNVKLITIFRNPVDRAYSAYNHASRFGWENSSFEDAINEEIRRIELLRDNNEIKIHNPDSTNYLQFSYLRHGFYSKNLKQWLKLFPKPSFLFLSTDDLKNDYQKTCEKIFNYFDIKSIKLKPMKNRNIGAGGGKYNSMKSSTRDFLIDFYKEHNEELFNLVGRKFNWNN